MQTLLWTFGIAETALLGLCFLVAVWGGIRRWDGLEIVLPFTYAFYGTLILFGFFLISVVVHDHVHIHLG